MPTAVLSDALGTGTRGQVPDDVPPARADCLCLRLQVWGPAPPGPASFKVGVGVRGGARFRVVFNDTATTEIYTVDLVGSVRCV